MFDVIVDTREQKPWDLKNAVNGSVVEETVSAKLDTGDYSIAGLEDLLCIERKLGVAEIANNITQKRFQKEIERMAEIKHSFIIIEGCTDYDILTFPDTAKLPRKVKNKIRVRGPFIFKKLNEYRLQYGIHIVLCENREMAEMTAVGIMKGVCGMYG
ncbi:ERCC4 domain-containing protein [Candidatus Pacearchaeota archaeon]|nr:ERCC4 domain-containing protein [Candidatus Pacearchaeota archaeon]